MVATGLLVTAMVGGFAVNARFDGLESRTGVQADEL